MKTTLNAIRKFSPCVDNWKKLLVHFGKKRADGTEVRIVDILDLLGVADALWALRAVKGHDREIRLFAVACTRRVQHLMTDQRSLNALDVSERFANGQATEEELTSARDAAFWAAYWAAKDVDFWAAGAAYWAARAAADGAADKAAYLAAYGAACEVAMASDDSKAELVWQAEELRRVCLAIEAGQEPYQKKDAS